jgi:hypothetical protein
VPPRATLPSVRAPIQEPSRLHLLPVFAHDVQPHFCPLSPPPRVLEQSRERFLSRQLQLAKPASASITLVTRPQPGARRIWANPCAQLDYVRDMRLLLKICNTSRHIPRVSHIPLHLALHPATSGSCRIRPGTSRESGASDATSGASPPRNRRIRWRYIYARDRLAPAASERASCPPGRRARCVRQINSAASLCASIPGARQEDQLINHL